MNKERPIGIFDSGIGGFTVLSKIRDLLPDEDLVYIADDKHAPYGEKSREFIQERSLEISRLLIGEYDAKAIVVACNTATTAAISYLRREITDVPLVGIVPMIKPAAQLSQSNVVAVMATENTLEGEYYQQLKDDFAATVNVIDQPCGGWVQMVEDNNVKPQQLKYPIEQALDRNADVLVLGCTHFPFLKYDMKRFVGDKAQIIEPGLPVAKQVRRVLSGKYSRSKNGEITAVSTSRGEFDVSSILSRLRSVEDMSL